ncbi:MAG: EAL domain-containing protein, partial [Methylobacter sp.]|nr:EAL domain-containing protein [Methylobacter sp.]
MNPKWDGSERRKSLREQAEAMVVSLSPDQISSQPAEILLHELLVHKVELEMQNEELRRAYSSLEEARDRYIDLYEFAPVGYITISREGLITEINLTGSTMLGWERSKLLKRRFSQFVAQPDRERWHRLFLNMMEHDQGDNNKHECGLQMTRADDSLFYAHLNCLPKMMKDEAAMLRIAMTDITQQKVALDQLEHLAFYDPLTDLPNRQLLKDRLHLAMAASARSRKYGALLFIDLDNFKTLNDTLGHNVGDLLLQQVAQRLLSSVRKNDTAARLGGDEFVVMLEDLSENVQEAAIHAEISGKKILAALNAPYLLNGHDYRCSSSIGATMFYDHAVPEDELLRHVDIAMYQAKHRGRNNLCFFDQAMQAVIIERAAMEADLRVALEQKQFILYYQQQITHDGQIVGGEVLIRWQHPERGLILPMDFIPLAEETGLILAIGQWVLESACAQLKRWESNPQTQHLQLAVNVSAHQFHQIDFVKQMTDILEKSAIDPSRLKLELTESMLLNEQTQITEKMHALKALGVGFSLDDFGTGYSSLSYLTHLPFDQLKIDRSFVHNIGVNHTDSVIVQTLIGMTSNLLDMQIIAEGVETEEQRAFLKHNGCG